jgi:glycosyltransferase involved in cell wall biosynthesis
MINHLQSFADANGAKYRMLMFAPAFAPFANPEAIVNSKLAHVFLDTGWKIDVITRRLDAMSSYDYGSEWSEPWLPLRNVIHEPTYEIGGRIGRLVAGMRDCFHMRHPIVGCRWAAHALELAFRLQKQNHYHVILSRSLPDFGHLPALVFSKKTGLPWVANWNDAFGDKNPPPAGKGVNADLGFFHERFLNKIARKADWLTFPSDRMRRYICKYLGNGTFEKSSTIPHVIVNPHVVSQRKKNQSFTICYAGNLYPGRNPEVFLRGVKDFLKSEGLRTEFKLFIIGLENLGLSGLIESFGLESNIELKGPLSYTETLDYCKTSDVLLVIEAPYEEGIYLPSKFVDYVQTGRPILAVSPLDGTLRDIISMHGGGIAVDCRSAKEISNALNEFYFHWRKNTLDDFYGSDRLYHLFSPETIIDSYERIFKNIGVASS